MVETCSPTSAGDADARPVAGWEAVVDDAPAEEGEAADWGEDSGPAFGPPRAFRHRHRTAASAAALGVSLAIHAALAGAVWWLVHDRLAAPVVGVAGDGAAETGLADLPGAPDLEPGPAGSQLPAPSGAATGPEVRIDWGAPDEAAAVRLPPLVDPAPVEVPPPQPNEDVPPPTLNSSAVAVLPAASRPPPFPLQSLPAAASEAPPGGASDAPSVHTPTAVGGGGGTSAPGDTPGPAAGDGGTAAGKAGGVAATGAGGTARTDRPGDPNGAAGRGIAVPAYPDESRRRGEEGTVVLSVEVLPDGTCGRVEVVSDAGHPRLAAAAVAAARRSRLPPDEQDGRPVRSTVRIPYHFTLTPRRADGAHPGS